jgi:hypothetical protein
VGGGGLADDLGESIVALMATGRGTTGGLVVGVGEEVGAVIDGGDEPALPRGVAGAARSGVAALREGRREEGERDAEAVAVEELGADVGEGGGGGDVVNLKEHGRWGRGGVAEAGEGERGERLEGAERVMAMPAGVPTGQPARTKAWQVWREAGGKRWRRRGRTRRSPCGRGVRYHH